MKPENNTLANSLSRRLTKAEKPLQQLKASQDVEYIEIYDRRQGTTRLFRGEVSAATFEQIRSLVVVDLNREVEVTRQALEKL